MPVSNCGYNLKKIPEAEGRRPNPQVFGRKFQMSRPLSLILLQSFLICLFLLVVPLDAAVGPITVTDCRGKTLVFDHPVQRVVCLIESALSGIYMLGQGEKVVGISTNVYQEPIFQYYAALDGRIARRELPAPGNWDFVSLEGVIALKPEVVIMWSQQVEVIAALEERGIPVFGVFIHKREDIDRELQAFGAMLGVPQRANSLLAFVKQEVQRLQAKLADLKPSERPKVYFMWAQSYLETSGRDSMVDELISLAGGQNLCGHLSQEHILVRLEQLLLWNPDVIIMWPHPRIGPEDILKEEQWQLLAAVQAKRVYQLPEIFLADLWTLKYLLAVQQLAVWLHPQRFASLDLRQERRRIFLELYGIDF